MKTLTIHQPKTHPAWTQLSTLGDQAARYRNQIIYQFRQSLTGAAFPDISTLRKSMNENQVGQGWEGLPYKLQRETCRQAQQSWRSWVQLRKTNTKAKPPHYLHGSKKSELVFSAGDQLSKREQRKGTLKLGGVNEPVAKINKNLKIKQIIVKVHNHGFILYISYQEKQTIKKPKSNLQAGLDIGIDNLCAVAIDGGKPLLVKGTHLKSKNRYYHKLAARYRSELPKGQAWSNRLDKLTQKRQRFINTELHYYSRQIVNHLVNQGVSELHIGWNEGLKTAPKGLGPVFNQRWRTIPHRILINQITEKCAAKGITVTETEESYTSKTSCIDGELPIKQSHYAGKRVKRGLFKTQQGLLLNDDINAAAQIIRKSNPNAFQNANGLSALVEQPTKVVGGARYTKL